MSASSSKGMHYAPAPRFRTQPSSPPPSVKRSRGADDDDAPDHADAPDIHAELAIIDSSLPEFEGKVYSEFVGTISVDVKEAAFDWINAQDAEDLPCDKRTMLEALEAVPGLYHKMGELPCRKEIMTGVFPKWAVWRQEVAPGGRGATNCHQLFLYWSYDDAGWYIGKRLNSSSELSRDEAGLFAYAYPDTGSENEFAFPTQLYVPYWAKKPLNELIGQNVVIMEPHIFWANRVMGSMEEFGVKAEAQLKEEHELKEQRRAAHEAQVAQGGTKHGGWAEKTGKMVVLYRHERWGELEELIKEHEQSSKAFASILQKAERRFAHGTL